MPLGTGIGEVRFKILTNLGNTATTHLAGPQPLDQTAPTYSGISTSTIEAGATCYFNITANDNVALSHYIFSTNNTGSWANDTGLPLLAPLQKSSQSQKPSPSQ